MRRFSTLLALGTALTVLAPASNAQDRLTRADGSQQAKDRITLTRPATPSLPVAPRGGSTTITQNSSQDIEAATAVACGGGGLTADNSFIRVFDLNAEGVAEFTPTSVEFGIETASSTSGTQPAVLRFYTLTNPAGPVAYTNFTSLGEQAIDITDADLALQMHEVTGIGTAEAGDKLVVELHLDDTDNAFYPGVNTQPEDGPTYLASTACGVTQPTTYAALGFPGLAWVLNVTGNTAPITGPSLSVSPGTIAFGGVDVGQTSSARTVTLTNNGTADVTITSITSTGAAFTVNQSGTDLTLAPDESTTLTVTFSPTASGPATGTITIVSNSPNSPNTVNLTGTGLARPANDDRANAFVITGNGTITGTNELATEEAGEIEASCQSNSGTSVWWTFTPATAGTLSMDLDNSDFDTVLSFFQPATTQIACDDDGSNGNNGLASVLTNVPILAGVPVYIRIAGNNSPVGSISSTFNFTGSITTAGEAGPSTALTALTATPNPVTSAARVNVSVATTQDVRVVVYDAAGRQVATLLDGAVAAGQPVELSLNASGLPAGVYVVRATGESINLTQRVTVVR